MKISLKYGLILGILLLVWDYFNYNFFWTSESWSIAYVPILIVYLFIHLGVREIKKKKYDNSITYKNATLSGLLITVYAGVLYAGGVLAAYPYGNDHFKAEYLKKSEIAMKNDPNITDEDRAKLLKEFEENLKSETMAKSNFNNILIFGTISSLLSASIHRRKINYPPGNLPG